ncbi:hypothetical protein [Deinococcus roseus]|uniref:Uncharacterized protein n=1 Tax=Deinococcus roseus TaxID=392414 RepID=A0ABQ2DAZ5_9DEIO|nr:hypothetical protein [Deinococcus roseus]GGJ50486.1 hypothetical protein GCM10008938_40510 [Deinococcus roseus]
MGHRANFILIDAGQPAFFTDRWSGIQIPNLTFWGEALTLQHLQSLQAVPAEMLRDSLWCEGAFLLDRDRKVLVFAFDYWSVDENPLVDLRGKTYHWDTFADVPWLTRCYLDMLRAAWPGWTIKFARSVDFCCPESFQFDLEAIPAKDLDLKEEEVFPLGRREVYLKFADLLLKDQRFDFRAVVQQVMQVHPQAQVAVDFFQVAGSGRGNLDREAIMRQVLHVVMEC